MSNELKDFKEFVNSNEIPDSVLSDRVVSSINRRIKAEPWETLIKAILIHLVAGVVTLAYCPQFGWNPFGASNEIPHLFMNYGMWACGMFCGALFIGVGSIIKRFLLPHYSQGIEFRNSLITCSLFFIILMGLAKVYGQQQVMFLTVIFSVSWLLGAVAFERVMDRIHNLVLNLMRMFASS